MTLDDQLADLWAAGATKPRSRDETGLAAVLDLIATLWLGHSQRQIARKLNLKPGVISGLVMRSRRRGDHRFPPRPDPTPRVKPPLKVRKPKPVNEATGNARPLRPTQLPKPVTFLRLQPGMCKFPVNSPECGSVGTTMLCCGAPIARPGANYCGRHSEIARARVSPSAGSRFVVRAMRSR